MHIMNYAVSFGGRIKDPVPNVFSISPFTRGTGGVYLD